MHDVPMLFCETLIGNEACHVSSPRSSADRNSRPSRDLPSASKSAPPALKPPHHIQVTGAEKVRIQYAFSAEAYRNIRDLHLTKNLRPDHAQSATSRD